MSQEEYFAVYAKGADTVLSPFAEALVEIVSLLLFRILCHRLALTHRAFAERIVLFDVVVLNRKVFSLYDFPQHTV